MYRMICWMLLLLLGSTAMAADDATGNAFFESKIRPVLVSHCYKCHSEQASSVRKLKGGLFLDSKAGVLKGGENGIVVVPGKPEESKLLRAVKYEDEDLQMPPKDRLPASVVVDFEKWIAMGAPDPRQAQSTVIAPTKRVIDIEAAKKYWAFEPLGKFVPPTVNLKDFARTPIDRFVLAKLEQKGLVPNSSATKQTLIRRAYADLIGLPPSPTEVDEFVNDPAPDAWEKLVDHLLASDRYGERWGRHWLDIVRFAESNGYEFDADRRGAYQYRDFVIRAFNRDMPFNEFVRWQLAGDQLMPGNYDAGAATGFLVAGPSPGQITAKTAEPLRYDQLDDMVSTLGNAMLGMTVGCCRCHDHKFDPLPQRDYYRLVSCFADCDAAELKLDPKPEVYEKAEARWKAEHTPIVTAWEDYLHQHLADRVGEWTREGLEVGLTPWLVLDADSANVSFGGTPDVEKLKKLSDDSLLLEARGRRNEIYTVAAKTYSHNITALRVEAMADKLFPKNGPGTGKNGEFLLTRFDLKAAPLNGKGKPVDIKLKAVHTSVRGHGKKASIGVVNNPGNGWSNGDTGKDQAAVFEFEKPVGFPGGTQLVLTLKFDNGVPIGRFRISIADNERAVHLVDGESMPQARAEVAALLRQSDDQITSTNRAEIARWMRAIDDNTAKAYSPVAAHLANEPIEQFERVFAAGVKGGRPVYFLGRGETNKKNGLAPPGFIEVLMNAPEHDDRWTVKTDATASASPTVTRKPTTRPIEPRIAMADWITDVENGGGALLARVMVNRLWQHHIGRGIVATPNDFGTQGDVPTHPELLDWMARALVENGWHLKPLQKLIMTSSVYMESGEHLDSNVAIDPDNRLCWRHPSQRLEAEAVRDSLLDVAGNLDLTQFGPGTLEESSRRRSVYLTVKRSKPVLFMQLFDSPETMQSSGQRQVTTVATQALTLMNSPLVRDCAQRLAKRVRPTAKIAISDAVVHAYRLTLCRPPSESERSGMVDFVERQSQTYASNGEDLAMVDFCQVLLCSDEFVYVD